MKHILVGCEGTGKATVVSVLLSMAIALRLLVAAWVTHMRALSKTIACGAAATEMVAWTEPPTQAPSLVTVLLPVLVTQT